MCLRGDWLISLFGQGVQFSKIINNTTQIIQYTPKRDVSKKKG